jgi:hypothetical protein
MLFAGCSKRYTALKTPRTLEHDVLCGASCANNLPSTGMSPTNHTFSYKDGSLVGLQCMAHVQHIPMGAAHESLPSDCLCPNFVGGSKEGGCKGAIAYSTQPL